MHLITSIRGRRGALAPATLLLLALCLLAVGAQAADAPRYVVGDILEISFANSTDQIVIGSVDTTSLPTPLYTAFQVDQNAGRWEIPRYWHGDFEYTEEQLANEHAHRVAHVDPVLVIITDHTITGGDTLYYGLSLAEARSGVLYPVEPDPGYPNSFPASYVVGDILGNVSDPTRGSVVSRSFVQDGVTWYTVFLDTVRSGDRWMIEEFYNGDMSFSTSDLDRMGMRRVAHADPHTVIVNDSTTSTGEMGWYRLSLAEVQAGKIYDWMGYWHFNTGDILASQTNATRYIVGSANISDSGPSHYTLYEVVRGAGGWEIPAYVAAGIPLETGLVQLDGIPFDFVDHTDPHFAVVTDPAVAAGITYAGLSLGEILGGTPGYPVELPPVGGDTGFFLVSTAPAGADVYLVDLSGTRYLQGNTSAGPLNVTVHLTATPMRSIVANLSGYRDAAYTITQYPAKGQTIPVSLTLAPIGPSPLKPLRVPGRIQAEDYNLGGEGVAYHDTTPGNEGGTYRRDDVDIETGNGITDVGWIRNGEYLTYTVNVTTTGEYTVTARMASPNSGRMVTLSVDGVQATTITVPNTGSFDTYRDVTLSMTYVTATMTPPGTSGGPIQIPIHLSAGTHTLTLSFQGDGQNLDWIETALVSPTPPQPNGTPYKPLAIPGTIQAEDFNLGGEGVAYHDTTPVNEGGAYRTTEGVDIETQGSVTNVGWIRNGEYLTYTANVTGAGAYAMTARVASPNTGRTIAVSVDGTLINTIAVPNTGSFSAFQTVQVMAPFSFSAGTHTLKLAFQGDGQNLDWIAFGTGGTTPPTTTTTTPVPSGGASFTAAPLTASHGSAVKFTVTPASGKSISAAWWSFDAPAHLNTWNSRAVNPTFFYPSAGTFSPLVKLTYTDGSAETVQRTNYVRAT
jgi:hypothetical protein